jgi:predicted DNA-binding transcriptional regulator YafY
MSKISKNIKMLDILSSGKVYSCKKLSEMLEVSPRTIRQYKDELEKEGIYIENIMGNKGGYRLCSKVEIPSILFNKNDIEIIDSVIKKLSNEDRNKLQNIKDKINTYCRLVSDKDNISIEDKNKIDILQEAIDNNKKITIEYYSKGIKKSREILPIQIYVYENMIMVVVHYSDDPNDIRHLNLKRIEKIII